MDPFEIYIGGEKLEGWTSATLERKRKDLTGSMTIEVFFTYLPKSVIMQGVKAGKDIIAYVGGNVAFTGSLDSRKGKGKVTKKGKKGKPTTISSTSVSSSIDSESYKITLTARGKTKKLIDSSHDHPTGQMRETTVKQIVDKLVESFKIKVIDDSEDSDTVERATFRDGATVHSEIHRYSREHNSIAHEDVNGNLKITKDSNAGSGDDLILGENILEFSAEQSEDKANNKITVKGQRTGHKHHGRDAIDRKITITDSSVEGYSPLVVQLLGDASDVRLKKRAKLEADKRTQESKEITIDVFHVQTPSGAPWDLNKTHYVEIPPEGIFDEFVVTELKYEVNANDTIKTTLTLSPPASKDGAKKKSDATAKGAARKAANAPANSASPSYPDSWTSGTTTVQP